jgi:starch-binding outer membrane protein, SusD/RagB family
MMTMRALGRLGGMAVWVTVVALGAACSNMLDVQNEQDILDLNLDTPDAIAPIMVGVAADFAVAYSDVAVIGGLFGGELIHTGSFPTWREVETGFGKRPSGTGNQLYNELSREIWVSDTAAVRIGKVVANADASPEVAEVLIYGAFAHLLMADHFCQGTIKGGPAISPDSLYKRAETIFTRAIAIANAATSTNKVELRNRATAGRARARLMLKNYTGARDDANTIPANWRFNAIYSANSTRENNSVATQTTTLIRREAGVNPRFYNDPLYKTDPRTPFRDKGDTAKGPDPTRKFVEQLKYPLRETPIAISSTNEARLIEAEAEARLGNLTRAVTLINQVRAASSLGSYSGTTQTEVLNQLYYERSAELWLQGQSLSDLRRFNAPFLATRLDQCFEIGQLEWDNNPNLGAGR